MPSAFRIIPSAARELLYKLTESLELPFTLSDPAGVVVASTAGQPDGQADPYALSVAGQNRSLAITGDQLRAPVVIEGYTPLAEHAGLLPPAPGIYIPVLVAEEVVAVLFARGEPGEIHAKATTAAAAAGVMLEFASAATASVHETLGPDMALRTLLRGSVRQARRAASIAKVAGWDLLLPRAALVIVPDHDDARLPEDGIGVVRELVRALAPNTPCGQLGVAEWVVLPQLPTAEQQRSANDIAREVEHTLREQGVPVVIGEGDLHFDLPLLPGLRRSYREAAYVAQWARSTRQSGVHSLRTIGALAFLAPGSAARHRMAHKVLGPLHQSPEILQTLRVFLESNLSLEAAARNSGQHRHTVRSHLQRAHELTGLDARQLGDALQLKLALLIVSPIQSV